MPISISQYLDDKDLKGVRQRERQVLGKKQDYSYLYLPEKAFDITFRGAREIEDEAWQRYQRTTTNDILYWLRFRYNEPGMQYDYIGNQVLITNHVDVGGYHRRGRQNDARLFRLQHQAARETEFHLA